MVRSALWTLAAALGAVAAIILPVRQAEADGACANPTQMDGFKTCADLAKAEQEGAFVLYTTDPEAGTVDWRHFMNTYTGIPAISSRKPWAMYSWPAP